MDEYPWGVEEERKGRRVVMAEKMAASASIYIGREAALDHFTRDDTRFWLARHAGRLGFSDREISAAVDEAITAAGGVP